MVSCKLFGKPFNVWIATFLGLFSKLEQEDDIKIPEMNLDLEDGAIKPISLLHRQSSDGDGDNESNDESNENPESLKLIDYQEMWLFWNENIDPLLYEDDAVTKKTADLISKQTI